MNHLFSSLAAATILLFMTAQAEPEKITLAAEDASLVGTQFMNAGSGFAGKGYVTGFITESNRAVWDFPAVGGDYDLQISFRSPYGHKDFNAILNGDPRAGSFPQRTNFCLYDAGVRHLKNGTNRLQIGGGMNWYDINQVVLIPATNPSARGSVRAGVVQANVRHLLNARPVATCSHGKLVPWTEGLDGDWSGEATVSAARAMGTATPRALPDDGRFPGNDRHPEVILNFSDAAGASPQVRRSLREDSYYLALPEAHYSRLMVFCMSANGPSQLDIALVYEDGTAGHEILEVPDWYNPIPLTDTNGFNLAADLAKWNKTRQMTETNHHYLHGFELNPEPGKILEGVTLNKSDLGTLTFWGATGELKSK